MLLIFKLVKINNNQRKILVFDVNAMAFAKARFALATKLKEIGIDSVFVSYSKECNKYLKERGANVVDIIDYFDKIMLPKNIENLLVEYEKKYDIPSINLMLVADINHTWLGRKIALESLAKHFIFWENFLEKNKVDFLVGGTERFIHEVPRRVSKKFDVPFYVWKFPPNNGYFLLLKESNGRWDFLNEYWEKNKNKPLSKQEKSKVVEFITKLKFKKERAHLLNARKPKITLKEIKFFFQRAFANLFIEQMKNPYGRSFLKIASERATRALRGKFIGHLYELPDFSEKYIFYPLHIQTDAQVLARCPQYKDQIALIKSLSYHLPFEYTLYVKEHPNNFGGVSVADLKEIKKIPNVKLINAHTHSHELIKNAQAILTINSNVGWEGLLYEKPVIVLGKAFYDITRLTYNVRDFYKLPLIIKKAVNQTKFDTNKMHQLVNAVLTHILPGEMIHGEGYVEQFCEQENLNKIVHGFKRVLLEKKHSP